VNDDALKKIEIEDDLEKLILNAQCEKHGQYESVAYKLPWVGSQTPWSKCPACTAESAKLAEENRKRRENDEKERRLRETLDARINASGIPFRFRDRRLSNYLVSNPGQKRALEFAENYAAKFESMYASGRCAAFLGKIGTGKTHLAVGIAHAVMEDGYSVIFTQVADAIGRVKDTWNRSCQESESKAIATLANVDLLILDELGAQHHSETDLLILYRILNKRYEQRLPTIFTANLEAGELKTYLGDQIVSRLREDDAQFIGFKWDDYRSKNGVRYAA
jgi:DNA replication protein DnaC